ncbi:MAG: thiamine biosynthesis lipoprotein [Phycisphaerales bacterium]|jgi:thiamine biosynthesis lipoprotein
MPGPDSEHSPVRAACDAMGCRFEICITDPVETDGVGFLRAVCEEAIEVITDWHRRLSSFDRGSVVSQLNRDAATAPVRVADDVMALLLACARVHEASGGAFDITVGPLMRRWGFRGPVASTVAEQPGAVWGQPQVRLDPEAGLVWFDRPGIELDLGGVAKGLALDDAAQVLRDAGVRSAILHGGTSTAIAIGPPPESPSMLIALGPEADAPVVELRDSALSVSAPHGRVVEREGQILGHVIDPRTGSPTDSARLAAIVGPSAMRCDAWSTALLVLDKAPDSLSAELSTILCDAVGRWKITGPTSERIRFRRQTPPG